MVPLCSFSLSGASLRKVFLFIPLLFCRSTPFIQKAACCTAGVPRHHEEKRPPKPPIMAGRGGVCTQVRPHYSCMRRKAFDRDEELTGSKNNILAEREYLRLRRLSGPEHGSKRLEQTPAVVATNSRCWCSSGAPPRALTGKGSDES